MNIIDIYILARLSIMKWTLVHWFCSRPHHHGQRNFFDQLSQVTQKLRNFLASGHLNLLLCVTRKTLTTKGRTAYIIMKGGGKKIKSVFLTFTNLWKHNLKKNHSQLVGIHKANIPNYIFFGDFWYQIKSIFFQKI